MKLPTEFTLTVTPTNGDGKPQTLTLNEIVLSSGMENLGRYVLVMVETLKNPPPQMDVPSSNLSQ